MFQGENSPEVQMELQKETAQKLADSEIKMGRSFLQRFGGNKKLARAVSILLVGFSLATSEGAFAQQPERKFGDIMREADDAFGELEEATEGQDVPLEQGLPSRKKRFPDTEKRAEDAFDELEAETKGGKTISPEQKKSPREEKTPAKATPKKEGVERDADIAFDALEQIGILSEKYARAKSLEQKKQILQEIAKQDLRGAKITGNGTMSVDHGRRVLHINKDKKGRIWGTVTSTFDEVSADFDFQESDLAK